MAWLEVAAAVGIVTGMVAGYRLVAARRRLSLVRIGVGSVIFLAVAVALGLFAAFHAGDASREARRAAVLAQSLSETMNCAVYGAGGGAAIGHLRAQNEGVRNRV